MSEDLIEYNIERSKIKYPDIKDTNFRQDIGKIFKQYKIKDKKIFKNINKNSYFQAA